jgi:hypothetical protein
MTEQRRVFVGGVSEAQRSEEERIMNRLGLEGLYWTVVRSEQRTDDLGEWVGDCWAWTRALRRSAKSGRTWRASSSRLTSSPNRPGRGILKRSPGLC